MYKYGNLTSKLLSWSFGFERATLVYLLKRFVDIFSTKSWVIFRYNHLEMCFGAYHVIWLHLVEWIFLT